MTVLTGHPCPEDWGDEVGCDRPGPHRCVGQDTEPHTEHVCECGSVVLDDLGPGSLAAALRRAQQRQADALAAVRDRAS